MPPSFVDGKKNWLWCRGRNFEEKANLSGNYDDGDEDEGKDDDDIRQHRYFERISLSEASIPSASYVRLIERKTVTRPDDVLQPNGSG